MPAHELSLTLQYPSNDTLYLFEKLFSSFFNPNGHEHWFIISLIILFVFYNTIKFNEKSLYKKLADIVYGFYINI